MSPLGVWRGLQTRQKDTHTTTHQQKDKRKKRRFTTKDTTSSTQQQTTQHVRAYHIAIAITVPHLLSSHSLCKRTNTLLAAFPFRSKYVNKSQGKSHTTKAKKAQTRTQKATWGSQELSARQSGKKQEKVTRGRLTD